MKGFSREQQVVTLVIALFLAGISFIHSPFHSSSKSEALKPDKIASYVEVLGDIAKPGIYAFSQEPTMEEVVRRAGGVKGNITLDEGWDKQEVPTGSRLVISIGEGGKICITQEAMDGKALMLFGLPININKANVSDLLSVPGIGETLAQNIIQFRESHGGFHTLEDLKNVRGIGEKRLSRLKRYLTIN